MWLWWVITKAISLLSQFPTSQLSRHSIIVKTVKWFVFIHFLFLPILEWCLIRIAVERRMKSQIDPLLMKNKLPVPIKFYRFHNHWSILLLVLGKTQNFKFLFQCLTNLFV